MPLCQRLAHDKDKFFVNMDDITARAKASAWYEVAYEGGKMSLSTSEVQTKHEVVSTVVV